MVMRLIKSLSLKMSTFCQIVGNRAQTQKYCFIKVSVQQQQSKDYFRDRPYLEVENEPDEWAATRSRESLKMNKWKKESQCYMNLLCTGVRVKKGRQERNNEFLLTSTDRNTPPHAVLLMPASIQLMHRWHTVRFQ